MYSPPALSLRDPGILGLKAFPGRLAAQLFHAVLRLTWLQDASGFKAVAEIICFCGRGAHGLRLIDGIRRKAVRVLSVWATEIKEKQYTAIALFHMDTKARAGKELKAHSPSWRKFYKKSPPSPSESQKALHGSKARIVRTESTATSSWKSGVGCMPLSCYSHPLRASFDATTAILEGTVSQHHQHRNPVPAQNTLTA